jgi:hypothetical protein
VFAKQPIERLSKAELIPCTTEELIINIPGVAMRKQFETIAILLVAIVAMTAGWPRAEETASAQAKAAVTEIPKFRADGSWPKLPSKWTMAIVSSTWIDEQDHLWVLQRPNTLSAEEKPKAAPPVLEFDVQGNFIQG